MLLALIYVHDIAVSAIGHVDGCAKHQSNGPLFISCCPPAVKTLKRFQCKIQHHFDTLTEGVRTLLYHLCELVKR